MPDPSTNPLIPAGYDVVWTTVVVVVPLLLVIALVSLGRVARTLTPTQALAWTLVAILIPVLGPLAWLFVGRRSAVQDQGESAA
ncbi:PLD nuclease N-terminal domain-containing protein [Microbacteriaceae bacterium 4G12]